MSTSSTITETTFEIVEDTFRGYGFNVLVNGVAITNRLGTTRNFSTRSSARKAVTRVRRPAGDRHR